MPFVMITWVPKACRNAETRKTVAAAVINALCTGEAAKAADITPDKVVVRFATREDDFPLPAGHTAENTDWKKGGE
eukprot:CAMPEP_0117655160 /NCGR_PEP_ID=MMETSP0804-20121206/4132_1 /TAXON_ID=1074897 /ORGANISM="Tetraselmis astigmatica, Strain CCMP880" /LENGTH=75 /DNA_ID=CAMNT_0005461495 /DNA_START=57 /DNA_END=284 /DNA_ORIENTATION=-